MLKHFKTFKKHENYIDAITGVKISPFISFCEDIEDIHVKHKNFQQQYLRIVSASTGTVSFNILQNMGTDLIQSISYTLDQGETWITVQNQNNKTENLVITVPVKKATEIYWKGLAQQTGFYDSTINDYTGSFFSSTVLFNVDGNVMSLLYGENFDDKTTLEYLGQFSHLFSDYDENEETLILNAKNLFLPTNTYTHRYYQGIFKNCTTLLTAPFLIGFELNDLEVLTTTGTFNGSYETGFTGLNAKQLLPYSVKVTMSGTDITSSVFKFGNKIIIPCVRGEIGIYAEAVYVNSLYEPVLYTRTLTRGTSANTNGFTIPYYPNNNTKLVADVKINQNTGNTVLYAVKNPNTKPSSTAPQFNFWVRLTTLANYTIMWGSANTGNVTNADGLFKFGVRNLYTCDKGVITYTNNAGNTYTRTMNGGTWSYTANYLHFFAENGEASNTYPCNGEIYRISISENDNVLFDYIPVKRLSDGKALLYNLVNDTVINLSAAYICPCIPVTMTLTNSQYSRKSTAITGNIYYAVIGETWIYQIISMNGYTFITDDAIFQVLINGVDKTSEVAEYDMTSDSWFITYKIKNDDVSIQVISNAASYMIKKELNGLILENTNNPVIGEPYSSGFIFEEGKMLIPSSVVVRMNNVDVTDTTFNLDTNTIEIDNVTAYIDIVAEAIPVEQTLLQNYELLHYIKCISRASKPGFDMGYRTTNNTKYYVDIKATGGSLGYFLSESGRNYKVDSAPYCYLYELSSYNYFWWNRGKTAAFTPKFSTANNKRLYITMDKGVVNYYWEGLERLTRYSKDARDVSPGTFTSSWNATFFGQRSSVADGGLLGCAYRYKHWESDELINDFIPAKKISNSSYGLLDLKTGAFKYGNGIFVSPYVQITNTLTNCTGTQKNGIKAGYTANYACLGEPWESIYNISNGYTFSLQDAIFNVSINGSDNNYTILDCSHIDTDFSQGLRAVSASTGLYVTSVVSNTYANEIILDSSIYEVTYPAYNFSGDYGHAFLDNNNTFISGVHTTATATRTISNYEISTARTNGATKLRITVLDPSTNSKGYYIRRLITDKTNDTSSLIYYDYYTDSYTVRLYAHWKDSITITANPASFVDTSLSGLHLSSLPRMGKSYNASLICDTSTHSLVPSSVIIKMNDVDITESVFNMETYEINIENVTGVLSISAIDCSLPSYYNPVPYMATLQVNPANVIILPYQPNYKSDIEFNVKVLNDSPTRLLISHYRNINSDGTLSDGRFGYWKRLTNNNYSRLYWGTQLIDEGNYSMKINEKNNVLIKNGSVTYTAINDARRTKSVSDTTEEWTANANLTLLGGSSSRFPYYQDNGHIYDLKVSEDDVLLHYWVPVENTSDNIYGLYDLVNDTFTDASIYIGPYIQITNTTNNCTTTRLSDPHSGFVNYMVIGKEWSCKYTPSEDYTFESNYINFIVMVNGVDKTSDYATYNRTNDTWTVTYTAHYNDEIIITAKAVAAYDAQVEYIEVENGAFINTNIKSNSNIKYNIDVDIPEYPSNYEFWIFGSRVSTTSKGLCFFTYQDGNNEYYHFGNSSKNTASYLQPGNRYILSNETNTNILNVTDVSTNIVTTFTVTNSTWTSDLDFYILTMNNNGNDVNKMNGGKLYSYKIYSSNELVRDCIPVRKDGEGYMFDKVSGELFGNAHTAGRFITGNEVGPTV